MPDPDLVVRTGEDNIRLSGFMSWQIEYAELILIILKGIEDLVTKEF